MKVQFKQPRSLDGVSYAKGIHEVPDSLSGHWYLLAMIQNDVAVILEGPAQEAPPVIEEETVPDLPKSKTYQEHMKEWESKEEKTEKKKSSKKAKKEE